MTRHRIFVWMAVVSVAWATGVGAQTPQAPSSSDKTDPSAASSPHQRDSTSTRTSEAPATQGTDPASASSPHQQQATGSSRTMKPVTPETFASQAAVIGQAEIELGHLALRNTKNEDVRKYAERMIKDHSAADKKLKAIAAKDNLQLPQSLDHEHKSLKIKLQGMSGEEFDREYVKAMATGHDQAVALFEAASQQPQISGDLKQFVVSTLPTLEQHKEMAHSLHPR